MFSNTATWPSGKAEACKAFISGSNPDVASIFVPFFLPKTESSNVAKQYIYVIQRKRASATKDLVIKGQTVADSTFQLVPPEHRSFTRYARSGRRMGGVFFHSLILSAERFSMLAQLIRACLFWRF